MAVTVPATPVPIPAADDENKVYYDQLKNIFGLIKTKEARLRGSIGTSEIIKIDGKINIKAPEHISVTGGVNIKDPHTIEVTGDCHSGFRKCLGCKKMFPTTDTHNATYCCGCALDSALYKDPEDTRNLYFFQNPRGGPLIGPGPGRGRGGPYGRGPGRQRFEMDARRTQYIKDNPDIVYGNSWRPVHNKIINDTGQPHNFKTTHPTSQGTLPINFNAIDKPEVPGGQYPCTINNYYAIPLDNTKKKVVQSGGSRNKKSDNNNKLKNKKSGNIHTKKRTAETKYNRTKRRGINLLN